ncbi:MAG: hypothetical protein ACRCX7_09965 [Cetobacterium sp.]|uniref:hypothetical protein n=1 Tax=Cetobacterium sp. TaxID=2071632 RepID=UPI003F2A79F7
MKHPIYSLVGNLEVKYLDHVKNKHKIPLYITFTCHSHSFNAHIMSPIECEFGGFDSVTTSEYKIENVLVNSLDHGIRWRNFIWIDSILAKHGEVARRIKDDSGIQKFIFECRETFSSLNGRCGRKWKGKIEIGIYEDNFILYREEL